MVSGAVSDRITTTVADITHMLCNRLPPAARQPSEEERHSLRPSPRMGVNGGPPPSTFSCSDFPRTGNIFGISALPSKSQPHTTLRGVPIGNEARVDRGRRAHLGWTWGCPSLLAWPAAGKPAQDRALTRAFISSLHFSSVFSMSFIVNYIFQSFFGLLYR